MGTYYRVYAEAKVGDRWYNLSPHFCFEKNGQPKIETGPIFWAQSAFWEVSNELSEMAEFHGIPEDMSDSLRKEFREDLDEAMPGWSHGDKKYTWRDYYNQMVYCVDFQRAICSRVNPKKPTKYEGYVRKRQKAEFEVYERDSFEEWLTEAEYQKLTDKQKRQWVYFQWDEDFEEYPIYRLLWERIRALKAMFIDMCGSEIDGLWNGIKDSDIRVYIYIS